MLSEMSSQPYLPSTLQPVNSTPQIATTLTALFNILNFRRAIIPACNGHCSARALARYYATLVNGGVVPPPHSSSSKPPLGSHPHIPKFSSQNSPKKQEDYTHNLDDNDSGSHSSGNISNNRNGSNVCDKILVTNHSSNSGDKIFRNCRIHDAFLGVGQYGNLVKTDGKYGLGFKRYTSKEGSLVGFGHSGMGGSTGFCEIKNRFAIAVTLNKLSFTSLTSNIIQLVCSELNIPIREGSWEHQRKN